MRLTQLSKIMLLMICAAPLTGVRAQGKGEIRKYHITCTEVYETDTTGAKVLDKKTCYDKDGEVIREENYRNGVLKETIRFEYNSEGDETSREIYSQKNELKEKWVYTYNKWGDKEKEVCTDATGKIIRTIVFSYDNKGLKTKRAIYDENGKLIQTKEWNYLSK